MANGTRLHGLAERERESCSGMLNVWINNIRRKRENVLIPLLNTYRRQVTMDKVSLVG